MGYKISSLAHLPFDDSVEMYIFSVGDGIWEGGLSSYINKNFDVLAREIGPNVILVGALNEEMLGEIIQTYLGKNYEKLKNSLPAILITDTHPKHLTEDSTRFLIPLKDAQTDYYDMDMFMISLIRFVKGESDELIQRLSNSTDVIKIADNIITVSIPVVPGIISVNGNELIKKLKSWWSMNLSRN